MSPISFFLAVIKVGTDGCRLPGEDGGDVEEVEEAATSTPAAAKQMSADTATAVSDPDGILTLKERQRTALKGFLAGKDVFASPECAKI